jgi:two-component system, NarL family, nitrate/nitrite response regulator NarL
MRANGTYAPPSGAPTHAIGIVSDVRLYREALAESLARRATLTVVWTAADLAAAVAAATENTAVAAVIDLAMHDSLFVVRAMRQATPSLAIVAFATHDLDSEIIACAEAGIGGLVSCDGSLEDLAAAVTRAARGEMTCSPRAAAVLTQRVASLAAAALAPHDAAALTTRERAILELLDRGLANKEIAAFLHIQVATVKNHVHSVLEKLRVASRGDAVAKHRAAGPPRSVHGLRPTAESPPMRI